MEPFMRAFAAAVLGGLMSIPGIVIGGELLGLIENFFGYLWPEWKPIVAFVVIVLVLCVAAQRALCQALCQKGLAIP